MISYFLVQDLADLILSRALHKDPLHSQAGWLSIEELPKNPS
jgi:hypothetical protein